MKQNGNMYDFIGATWNPLAGECPNNCSYCYVKSLKNRHKAVLDKYSGNLRLDHNALKKLPKEDNIFVCSCNDLFAEKPSIGRTAEVLDTCFKHDKTFYFQTKNPDGFRYWDYPKKSVKGVTIETNRYYPQFMGNCKTPEKRFDDMLGLITSPDFITIEPIMDFDLKWFVEMIFVSHTPQVNIGADSKNSGLLEPPKEKLLELINELEKFTTVNRKNNLKRLLK